MIHTCTLNPSIDYLVEIDDVRLGTLNRAKRVTYNPGGKGINVSIVLKNLEVDSNAFGYLGGFTGNYIRDELEKEGISHSFIEIEEPTRINIKLRTENETEINGQGSSIPLIKQEELVAHVTSLTTQDYLVLAGSLPPAVSIDFYERLAKTCRERSIPFVVDTSGPSLEKLLQYEPFLIKPNHHELGELMNESINSIDDALLYGRKLLKKGPKNIIVSMGGNGAVFINREIIATAAVPKGEVKSTVGAGDSTVAGFLASFISSKDFIKAFQYGVAAGTATAFSNGLCTKQSVLDLLPKINIEIIERG